MYRVEVRITDLVLEQLSDEQFSQFRRASSQPFWMAELLGFSQRPFIKVTTWCDYPYCDKVMEIYTKEVIKPELFGHELPYTAEAL